LGYSADFVQNGLEAVNAVNSFDYDLIFMDIQMPNMNGLEASQIIKRNVSKNPKIIAMTASAMKEDRDLCFFVGMDDYMSKPMELDNIYSLLLHWGEIINRNLEEVKYIAKTKRKKINDLVFDKDVLGNMATIFEEEEKDFIIKTTKNLRSNLENQVTEIISNINNNDFKMSGFLSHKLKGTCFSFGINKLAKHLDKIELYSKEEDISNLNELGNDLNLLVIEFINEFEKFEKS